MEVFDMMSEEIVWGLVRMAYIIMWFAGIGLVSLFLYKFKWTGRPIKKWFGIDKETN